MDNNDADSKKHAKKKLTILLAGGITFIIFFGWIFYFTAMARSGLSKGDDPFALFSVLKENTSNAFSKLEGAMGNQANIESTTTTSTSTEETATTTETQ